MSYHLLGPRPFDLAAPGQSARLALASWAAGPEPGSIDAFEPSEGVDAGLYLLVDAHDALRGFWIVFGETWFDDGVGPGRVPPYAQDVLEAATEEIWWERLKVAPVAGGTWTPLIVLEWPQELADRSSSPPPGVRPVEPGEEIDDDPWEEEPDSSWLEPTGARPPGFDEPDRIPTSRLRWSALAERRSLITLVSGALTRRAGTHEGRFTLVVPTDPVAPVAEGVPLATWLDATHRPPTGPHRLMHPLQLPGGRAGFPIAGWLTRDLELSPSDVGEIVTGTLVARDIHSRLWGQIALAGSITLLVLLGVLGVSGAVHLAAMPRLESAASVPPVHAQPAMSVCSADHRRFVEAFRCRVRHLASGGMPGAAVCGEDPGEDLQAAYCGLRDRAVDGWTDAGDVGYGELAAASACFEVLGGPYSYAKSGEVGVPDVTRLLRDEQLKVSALVDLVTELDGACDVYRQKLEARVGGAVLATHVGDRSVEGTALGDLAFRHATRGANTAQQACWRSGRESRVEEGPTLAGLCGPDPADAIFDARKSWLSLGGEPEGAAVTRYVGARFGGAGTARGLWACHLELDGGVGGPAVPGAWDLELPHPRGYGSGGVTSQLVLDAGVMKHREAGTQEVCWSEVQRMLGSYEPVHPLLDEEPTAWPSPEQQVCAQACAAGYRVSPGPTDWVTPGTDLSVCTTDGPPPATASAAGGEGRFDVLRMPWNAAADGAWVPPSSAEVCAFNLVAQGRLPVVPEDLAAPLWAGELASGSGIAGGEGGASVRAAESLGAFGRNRSSSTCGHVAVQCFSGELLSVLQDRRLEVHQWRDAWRRRVRGLPQAALADLSPWCQLVRPYVREDGTLPEGEFDYPCARGVELSRQRVETAIQSLAEGSFGGTR